MRIIAAAAAVVLSTGAYAADLPTKKAPVAAPEVVSPWDFEVGGQLTTDYIFRGITQSNHSFSVWSHGEIRYNINDMFQLYAGVSGESVKLTNVGPTPTLELDGYAGVRFTYGALGLDVGGIYYGYPNTPTGITGVTTPNPVYSPKTISWFELYAKPTYTVTDWLTLGANFFYTPSYLNTGANGEYVSATAKFTLPYGFSLSGELGRQFLGSTDQIWFLTNFNANNLGFQQGKLPSYTYWNVGASYTWKFVTFDVRYHGTSLSKAAAMQLTGIGNAGPNLSFPGQNLSTYARGAIVGTVSFALTGKDIK